MEYRDSLSNNLQPSEWHSIIRRIAFLTDIRETKEEKLMAKAYYDLSNGSAFLGPRKIYEYLKKKNSLHVPSIYKIRKWLERNDNYTLQKPVKRARVLVSEP